MLQVLDIDDATGEVKFLDMQTVSVMDVRVLEGYKKKKALETRQELAARQSKNPFVWEIYELSKLRWPDVAPANITRMMFLSTYLSRDGFLVSAGHQPLTRDDLPDLLQCSERQFYNFWRDMKSAGVFVEKDERICSDGSKFFKGDLGGGREVAKMAEDGLYVMRLYVNGVRELYKKATAKSLKTLSYIFQILPFVNREYNVVCRNPLETDLQKIEPMTLGEFCEIVGYDSKNAYRMSKQLFSPTFMVGKSEQRAVRYVLDKSLDRESYSIFINPNVYYAGSNPERVEILGAFRG